MKDKEKTEIILKCLKQNFSTWGRERSNVLFPELRLGSGYCGVAQRRIDLFMISSNAGNPTTAFEIKVSRQDFKKDINDDMKQRGARLYANEFYYVAPKDMLKTDEIPLWAGLLEFDFDYYDPEKDQFRFIERVPAPLHAKACPSWGLICAMVRHINKDLGIDALTNSVLSSENRKLKLEVAELKKKKRKVAEYFENHPEYKDMLTQDLEGQGIYWNIAL